MAANGGIISVEDLAQYRAMERKPLEGRYRGHRIYAPPAPTSDGMRLIETLQILDNYTPKPAASYASDPDYLHYVIEAWRVRDGGGQIADPERWPIDLGNHLQPGHALERATNSLTRRRPMSCRRVAAGEELVQRLVAIAPLPHSFTGAEHQAYNQAADAVSPVLTSAPVPPRLPRPMLTATWWP